ncbi:MAG: hypothetical protein KatS3mg040_0330 [Candidatus Kapaibacterium sp.]|nr:MAG: hypothetical protein KatS3mg040_0330 [Candidatus Kapabacteria bacterium]
MENTDNIFDELVRSLQQLKSASEQLTHAQKTVSKAVTNSDSVIKAAEHVVTATEEFLAQTGKFVSDIGREFKNHAEAFRESITRCETEIINDYTQRVGELSKEYDQIVQELRASEITRLVQDIQSMHERLHSAVEQFRSAFTEVIGHLKESIPTPETIASITRAGIEAGVEGSIQMLRSQAEEVSSALTDSVRNIQGAAGEIAQSTSELTDKLAGIPVLIRQNLTETADQLLDRFVQVLPDPEDVGSVVRQGIEMGVRDGMNAIHAAIAEFNQSLDGRIQHVQDAVRSVEGSSESLSDRLVSLQSQLQDLLTEARNHLLSSITTVAQQATGRIHEDIERFQTSYQQRMDSLLEKIAAATKNIAQASSYFEEVIQSFLRNLEKSNTQFQRTTFQRIDELSHTLSETLHSRLSDTFRDDVLRSMEQSSRQYESLVVKLQQSLQALVQSNRDHATAVGGALGRIEEKVEVLTQRAAQQQKDVRTILVAISVIGSLLALFFLVV